MAEDDFNANVVAIGWQDQNFRLTSTDGKTDILQPLEPYVCQSDSAETDAKDWIGAKKGLVLQKQTLQLEKQEEGIPHLSTLEASWW